MIRNPLRYNFFIEGRGEKAKKGLKKKVNYHELYQQSPFYPKTFSFFRSGDTTEDQFGRIDPELVLFGRIDGDGDAIMPKNQTMGPAGQLRTVNALDFVARAFNDLYKDLTTDRVSIKLDGSPYKRPNPRKGWIDVHRLHSIKLQQTYDAHLLSYASAFGAEKIMDFDDFIAFFIKVFFKDVMIPQGIMLTRSNFALSRYSDPAISGLVIELSTDDHNDDGTKYKKWLNNNGYPIFRESAARHGFMVDRNAPWRLIANPNSPRMQDYMSGKDLTLKTQDATDTIFVTDAEGKKEPLSKKHLPAFYEKIYTKDVDFFKETMLNLYNKFVSDRPTQGSNQNHNCGDRDSKMFNAPTTARKQTNRYLLSREEMLKKYDNLFWLNQYLLVRLAEVNADINEARIKRAFKKIYLLNKYQGYDRALAYVHNYAKASNPSSVPIAPAKGLTVYGATPEAFSAIKEVTITEAAGDVGPSGDGY